MNETVKTFTRREVLAKTLFSVTGGYTIGNTLNSAIISHEISEINREIKKLKPKLNPPSNDEPIFSANGAIREVTVKAPATPTAQQIKDKDEAKKELADLKKERSQNENKLEKSNERIIFGGIATAWTVLFNFFIDSVNERS